ncbi:MAG: preprotein translocase subunit SecG [Mariniphaga sp.]|nr:preprotein translocase subunit SecG [Mariniphaga sp.]
MYTLITVLIFIICILLILIVLVQNSKGGGLASNFQSSNQIMGVRKTTDFLEKATWVLAGSLLVLSIMGSAFTPREKMIQQQSRISNQIENAIDPTQVPNFPITAPESESGDAAPAEEAPENNN